MTIKTLKALAAAAIIGAGALTLSAPAFAGGHYHGGGGWHGGYHGGYHGGGWHGGGWGPGAAVGAGIVAGALLGSALAEPPPPPVAYYGPGYGYYGPTYAAYAPPAWSPAWYNYCASRYQSFNPRTGYFIGYDGNPYFCR